MCRGNNIHSYCVSVKTHGVPSIEYSHKSYKAAAKHVTRLNGKKQPRLSRWYNAHAHPSTSYAKVMITRHCPKKRYTHSERQNK